jgi:peptide/nickel transport system substrate-binding protein
MARSNREAWSQRRVSRRHALGTINGAALAIASVACTATSATPTPAAAIPPTSAPGVPPVQAAATATTAPRAAKRGGRFRWAGTYNWANLDPHQQGNAAIFGFVIGQYYSRLLKIKVDEPQPAYVPVADLAESWTQPDDLTYLFKLRANVKWQNVPPVNGRALVADDVAYSFDRQRTKGYPNASILDAVSKVEAVDKSTVRITLNASSADFPLSIAAPQSLIVAREAVDLHGDLKDGPLIGTGAFIVDKTDPTGTSILRRNPDYFLPGLPYVDTYEYTVIQDSATLKAAFQSGNTDVLMFGDISASDEAPLKKALPDVVKNLLKGYSGLEVALRSDRPPFNDLRVRQAVYKAIDPEAIRKTAYDGAGWYSLGFQLPTLDWSVPQDELARLTQRDLAGARKLLGDAGLANGLDITLTVMNIPSVSTAAELVAAQLKEANIRATLKPVDVATYQGPVYSGDFEALIGSPVTLPSTDAALLGKFHSKGSRNLTKLNDPKLDQMIERQTTLGRSPEDRKKALLDVQRYILDQAYVHHIVTFESVSYLRGYVRDLFNGLGIMAQEPDRFARVWLDT